MFNRQEYIAAQRKIRRFATIITLVVFLVSILVTQVSAPALERFGVFVDNWEWSYLPEWIAAFLSGIVLGLPACLPICVLVLCFIYLDRRHGKHCPGCGCSLTLRSRNDKLLANRRCPRCGAFVIEDAPP